MSDIKTFSGLQSDVENWMLKCFNITIAADKIERSCRFIEEALELVQACHMSKEDVLKLVDYTYDRPLGEPQQEVGGVVITLSALCSAQRIHLVDAAVDEYDRINNPDVIERIQEKQLTKPHGSPLPGTNQL